MPMSGRTSLAVVSPVNAIRISARADASTANSDVNIRSRPVGEDCVIQREQRVNSRLNASGEIA